MQSVDREVERQRCYETALKSRTDLMNAINKLEWCASYDKNGVKSWVAPVAEQEKEFRAMGQTRINRPPKAAFDYIMDMKYRPAWDKILNEHKIEDEFSKDEHHRTVLWTMKFRPRYLKMKRRVSVFSCYVGEHPVLAGGYMISMASINTFLAPVSCDEIAFDIPISGYIMSPDPEDPNSTILTYVLRVTIQIQHLGFMERSIMRSISQWGPPHMITDRLSKLRSLIEEKSVVSVVNNFPHARDSFLRDFEYIKKDPIQSRDDLIMYYCGEECDGKWAHVTTERGLVIKKFTGPLLHSRHNLALKLSFSTVNFIQFSRCLSEPEKRLIWEPCATKVEHIWDDGPMNICLKVSGGGSQKGCGSPKFDVFVYHVYSYGLKGDSDSVDSCVYEEHSDGNMLLVMLTADRPSSNIDVLFFTNTALYSDRSRTSLTFLPASPLAPIERTLLESVIEFRNVVELDTWLPTESIERLSLSTVSKVATGQRRSLEMAGNTAHKVTMPAVKRKQIPSPVREDVEDAPLLGKVKNYFNKLPSFSSMFSFPSQHPIPAKYSRSNNNGKNTSIHLLFPSSPNKDPDDDYLMNCLPYELLVHIIKYVNMEDVRACSQLCHRAWQVTNCDLVWRDQVLSVEAQKQDREGWENYAPLPHFSATPASPSHAPASPDSPFEKPVWLRASVDSHSSSSNPGSLANSVASSEMEILILSQEERRQELTSLLDSVQVYSSPFKWEYLQGVAVEKCWKYGVSNYSGYDGMVGESGMILSEEERQDTVLVGSAAGQVRGIIPANLESPSSRVLFSFNSHHSVVQVQWCGDKAVALYNNGEIVQYNKNTQEQTSRLFITPMTGGFFFKNDESPSLLASYVGDKLRVWNTDDGSKMFKFRSSRGNITNVRLSATKCVAVTAMHALYTVNMLDLPTGNLQTCLSGHQGEITAVRLLDHYSNIVASASRDVWDLRSGIQIAKQYIHSGVEVNAFSPTNDKLVAALSSGEISYWDPRNATKPVASFSLPTPIQPNMLTQDNKRLLATWNTGLLSTWVLYPRLLIDSMRI